MHGKKILPVIPILILLVTLVCACQAEAPSGAGGQGSVPEESAREEAASGDSTEEVSGEESAPQGETMIYAHIGDNTLTIRPENNSSAEAFVALLQEGDVTIDMHEYGGFEKVGPLGTTLPTNDENITTQPGDVILYQGDQITIYYDTNTWNFTRLGRVQGMTKDEIRAALGEGDPTVVFSLQEGKESRS